MLMQWIQMLLHITLVTGNQRSTVICMKHINKGLCLHVVTDINLVYFFLKGRTWLWTLQMTCMTMLIFSPHISNFMGTLLLNNISELSFCSCAAHYLTKLHSVITYSSFMPHILHSHDGCLPNKFFLTFNVLICIAASLISFHFNIHVGSTLLRGRL